MKKIKIELSKNAKENIIIALGLLLFLIVIILCVYFVLKNNNPNAFKSKDELYNELLQNMILSQNNDNIKTEEDIVNDGTFSVYVDNIYVEGKLPRMMKEKFYIECFEDGLINIYSKYTYALSKSKYDSVKGIILKIRIAKDDMLDKIKENEGEYNIITKINDYNIISIIPNTIEYIKEDDVSVSNYNKLVKYRDEIIKSIIVKDNPEGIKNFIEIDKQ